MQDTIQPPESPVALTLTPELAALLAAHPHAPDAVQAGYELGLADLRSCFNALGAPRLPGQAQGRPPYRCLNDMPRPLVWLLNCTVAARTLELCLPFCLQYLPRDERRLFGLLEPHLRGFLQRSYSLLAERGLIPARLPDFTALAASQQFADDMADLLSECLHELNSHADPRLPLGAMHLYNELNLVAAGGEEAI